MIYRIFSITCLGVQFFQHGLPTWPLIGTGVKRELALNRNRRIFVSHIHILVTASLFQSKNSETQYSYSAVVTNEALYLYSVAGKVVVSSSPIICSTCLLNSISLFSLCWPHKPLTVLWSSLSVEQRLPSELKSKVEPLITWTSLNWHYLICSILIHYCDLLEAKLFFSRTNTFVMKVPEICCMSKFLVTETTHSSVCQNYLKAYAWNYNFEGERNS